MIPLAVPDLSGKERDYLNKCIDTTFVSSVGEFVERLEQMTASFCGARYGVASSSGTTGLHLALLGYGVENGDLVIIPDYTFIATANAVAHCGAVPWLFDIEEKTWTLDVDQVERAIKKECSIKNNKLIHNTSGKKVAAIMPVYTVGNVPYMSEFMEIGEKYGIPVIADAACAIGAEYYDKKIGEISDCAVISLNGNKTITAGGGGMIVGNNKDMMQKLKHLSTTARVTAEYDFDMVGFNYRMTNLQAAIGCAQMERAEQLIEKKRYIRSYYDSAFSGDINIDTFPKEFKGKSSCWFSGIVLEHGGLDKIRRITSGLKEKGIEARSFWKPVHMQKPYQNAMKYGDLRISEELWDKIVVLPCSTGIKNDEIEEVVKEVKNFVFDRKDLI